MLKPAWQMCIDWAWGSPLLISSLLLFLGAGCTTVVRYVFRWRWLSQNNRANKFVTSPTAAGDSDSSGQAEPCLRDEGLKKDNFIHQVKFLWMSLLHVFLAVQAVWLCGRQCPQSAGPPLWPRLKYLNNYWMDCRETIQTLMVTRGWIAITLAIPWPFCPLVQPWGWRV